MVLNTGTAAVSLTPERRVVVDMMLRIYGPDGGEEVPSWKKQLSFRGQPYRYAQHQNGVMGHFQVRKTSSIWYSSTATAVSCLFAGCHQV